MLPRFERLAPKSLKEAIKLYSELGESARLYAGGTDVFVQMRSGKSNPKYLIDLKDIGELKGIEYTSAGELKIGAATILRDIENHSLIKSKYPVLFDGVSRIGSPQIRNIATIGGNICNALPSADSVPALLALGAKVRIDGVDSQREVPLEEFFRGPGRTVLAAGEIMKEIVIPPLNDPAGSAYLKFTRRKAMDLALLGVAVYLEFQPGTSVCRLARIALATAGPTPLRAYEAEKYLKDKEISADNLREAGIIASREAKPRSSFRAPEDYRRKLITVLVRRAGLQAAERISGAEVKK